PGDGRAGRLRLPSGPATVLQRGCNAAGSAAAPSSVQPRPQVVGVGVVEPVEDVQGLPPRVAGGPDVARGVVGVAEVGEGGGLVLAAAEVPELAEGVRVAGDGLSVVAEVVVGVSEAVPRVGLPVLVVEFLVQGEGLPAVDEGLFVVAEHGLVPADVVEGGGLAAPVVDGPIQVQGFSVVVECLGQVALPVPEVAEGAVGFGLTKPVTGLGGQLEGVPQLDVGVVEAAEVGVRAGEGTQGPRLCIRLGQPEGGGQRG